MAIEFPPECAWLFAILTGEVPPDGDEDKMFALAEVHRDLQGKLNQDFQALVAEALGFTKEKFDGDAGKMYQEAMKSFLGGQEGLDYFKAVGDQAQLMADFTRKSATQLQYTKYMIIAQLIMLLVEAAIAAATAFFFGASIAAYMQKMAIIRWLIKSWIGRMILTLLTHQVINVGLGVALDAMVQWVQLNQGSRDEWDTELTKNAALSGMVQGLLAGPFNFLGDRFGKFLAKRFGLDAGPDLGKQIDDILNPPKPKDKSPDLNLTPPPGSAKPDPKVAPTPDPDAPTPPPASGKPETTGSTSPPNGTTPKPEGPVPPPPGKPDPATPKPSPEPKKSDSGTGKGPSPAPERSFGQNLTEAFRKHLPNTHGPTGPKVQQEFIKDVGEAFQKQFGDKAGKEAAREAGENWAKALLEKTGTKGLPDDLGNALKPITGDLGDDLTKVLTKGASDALGLSIMREIVEGTGRGLFEGAHAAVSEGMYNLIFSDEHTFKTSGLTFGSGMVEGRLNAMMEAGGENLAMGLRGNLGMDPPSGLTAGDLGPGGDSSSPAAATSASTEQTADSSFDEDSDYGLAELFAHEDDDLDYLEPWEGDSDTSEGAGDGPEGADGRDDEQPENPPVSMVSGPAPMAAGTGGGSPAAAVGGGNAGSTAGGNTATGSSQAPAAAQPSGTGSQQQKSQPNGSDQSSSTSGPGGTDSTGHRPTDLSTEGGSPPQDQSQNRNEDQNQGQGQDQDRNGAGEQSPRHDGEQGDDASAGEQNRPVTESTTGSPNPTDEPDGEHGDFGHRSATDENTSATPIPPVMSSDGPTDPERTPVADSADETIRTEAGPVSDTTSGERARTEESVPRNTDPTPVPPPASPEPSPSSSSLPSPEADQQAPSGRRSRLADDDTPLHPTSPAPPTNDTDADSSAHLGQGVMSEDDFTRRTTSSETGPRELPTTVLRPGDGVMSPDEFKRASSGSGIRSKSAIDAVDKALGAYHRLPAGTDPLDRAFEVGKIVTACDSYLNHKASGGGPRIEGVRQLKERASFERIEALLQATHEQLRDAGPDGRRNALEGLVTAAEKYPESSGDIGGPRAATVRQLGERAGIGAVDTALRALHGLPENAGPMERIGAFMKVVGASDGYLKYLGDGGGPRAEGVRALGEQARTEGSLLGEETFRQRLEALDTLLREGRLHEGPSLPGEAQRSALAIRPERFHSITDELVQELFSLGEDSSLPDVTRSVIEELKEVKRLVTVMQYGKGGMKLTSPTDAPPAFTFNVDTQARSGTSFLLGHIAHELTHVAAFQTFGSSPVMELAPSGTTTDDIQRLAGERSAALGRLRTELDRSDVFGGPRDVRRLLLEEKLVYGRQKGKLEQYANTFWDAKLKWEEEAARPGAAVPAEPPARQLTAHEKARLLAWDKAAGDASGTLVEYDTVLNQMLVYMHQWGIPADNPFYALLREEAETAYTRRNPDRPAPGTVTTPADTRSSNPAASMTGGSSSAPIPTTSTTSLQTSQAPPAAGPAPTRPNPPAQPTPTPVTTSASGPVDTRTPTARPAPAAASVTPPSAGTDRASLAYQLLTSSIPPAPPLPPPAPGRSADTPLPAPRSAAYASARPDSESRPPRSMAERTPAPVTAEQLTRIDDAPLARVHTERFDPVLGQSNRRPGLLDGSTTLIRNHVRREHLQDGRTVRHFVITLPVRTVGDLRDGDVRELETRLQNTLNETLNSGYTLPKSGDQLRITVELEPDPKHGEAVTLTRDPKPGRADQLHWDTAHGDGTLVHELLHYLGLPDEYLDTSNGRKTDGTHVFRSDSRLTGVQTSGPMVRTERHDLDQVPVDYLKKIEDVSDTVNIPSHTREPSTEPVPTRSTDGRHLRLAQDDVPTHSPSRAPVGTKVMTVAEFEGQTSLPSREPVGADPGDTAQDATSSQPEPDRLTKVRDALSKFEDLSETADPKERMTALNDVVVAGNNYLARERGADDNKQIEAVRALNEAVNLRMTEEPLGRFVGNDQSESSSSSNSPTRIAPNPKIFDPGKADPRTTLVIRAENSGDMYHMRAALIAMRGDVEQNPYGGKNLLVWNVSSETKNQANQIVDLHEDLSRQGLQVIYTAAREFPVEYNLTETSATEKVQKYFIEKSGAKSDRDEFRGQWVDPEPLVGKPDKQQKKAQNDRRDKAWEEWRQKRREEKYIPDFAELYGSYSREEGERFHRDLQNFGNFQDGQKYVIVPFRATGHSDRKGANAPALDTGTVGYAQIARAVATELKDTLVVPMGEMGSVAGAANLTNYWTWPSVKDGGRRAELSLLKYLADEFTVVGAVGMRSGIMDELAFAGIKIVAIDISPHRMDDGLPNRTVPKGWSRGLKLEDVYGRFYGHAFTEHPRENDTKKGIANWEGKFHDSDIRMISHSIKFYLGDESADSATLTQYMHSSHPLMGENFVAGLNAIQESQFSAYDVLNRIKPYLNELDGFKAGRPADEVELLKNKLKAVEARIQEFQGRASEVHEIGKIFSVKWMMERRWNDLLKGNENGRFYNDQIDELIKQSTGYTNLDRDALIEAYQEIHQIYNNP
ncbi:hypothetical protein ABZ714_07285 [Streptomyces sp. NPDC006798]|uniref:WXG100-like domain-containing protein n=1 Tax=Streptomyces sp. NPDC006798 TaxID=3155462 RepID=UPI00340D5BE8